MNKSAKKIKQSLIARYRAPATSVPIAIRERPHRTQFYAFAKDAADGAKPLPAMPDPMAMQAGGSADPMLVAQLLGSALDQGGLPDPTEMAAQEMAQAGGAVAPPAGMPSAMPPMAMPPMMAGERLPPSPGTAQAASTVPAQAGPGIDHRQILAALFGA